MDIIKQSIQDSIAVKQALLTDEALLGVINQCVDVLVQCFQSGGKALFCGNGGSAADAQHLAAELSGRFYINRPPLYAEALHVNSSYVTAVANDFGYEDIYARMTEAAGRKGDVLIAISTSGNSHNIIKAAEKARSLGMTVIGMTGAGGGKLAAQCHYLLDVPSNTTPRIQECHILMGHIICQLVEARIWG